MKKITIIMNEDTEKMFQYIIDSKGRRINWNKIPSYKSIVVEAIELLYKKEKDFNEKN